MLSRLEDFLMKPLIQGYSGTAPETSRNAFASNQGLNEDDFQSDPHPKAGIFHKQMARNSGPEDSHDINWDQSKTSWLVLILFSSKTFFIFSIVKFDFLSEASIYHSGKILIW